MAKENETDFNWPWKEQPNKLDQLYILFASGKISDKHLLSLMRGYLSLVTPIIEKYKDKQTLDIFQSTEIESVTNTFYGSAFELAKLSLCVLSIDAANEFVCKSFPTRFYKDSIDVVMSYSNGCDMALEATEVIRNESLNSIAADWQDVYEATFNGLIDTYIEQVKALIK